MKMKQTIQISGAIIVGLMFSFYFINEIYINRDVTWHWEDEAQLSDGTRLWISRTEVRELRNGGEPFQPKSRGIKIARLELPSGTDRVVWEARMEPMIVERGSGSVKWTVIASTIWCEEYLKYGSPNPPYIQFEYTDRGWQHRTVDPKWYGRPSNLLTNELQKEAHDGGRVSAEKIVKANAPASSSPRFTRYSLVTQQGTSNCKQ